MYLKFAQNPATGYKVRVQERLGKPHILLVSYVNHSKGYRKALCSCADPWWEGGGGGGQGGGVDRGPDPP